MAFSGVKRVALMVGAALTISGAATSATGLLIRNQQQEEENRLQESPAGQMVSEEFPGADDFELVEPNQGPASLEFRAPNGSKCEMAVKVNRTPIGGKGGGWELEVSPAFNAANNIICDR